MAYGYVFSNPMAFVMGRPVDRNASYEDILNPSRTFENPDCWWVWLAAGKIDTVLEAEPFPLPYYGWEIRNQPRFHTRERLLKCIKFIRSSKAR
jgi:hypothetical protein